jgi:phage-related protein
MGSSTNTRTITIKFAGNTKDLTKAAAESDLALKVVGDSANKNSGGLDKMTKSMKDFGESVGKLAGPARIVGALTTGLSLVNKTVPAIIQASGALGLLPGALATAEIARKVFSLGMDSLKKQLAGVSKQLQSDVQPVFEKAFRPASSWVQKLIPDIKNVATAEAGVVTQTLKMLDTQDSLSRVHSIFGSTSTVVQNLGAAFTPLLHALLTFTDVSASAFARLTSTAGDWATRLDAWVTKVANNGQLYNWIERGVSKLEELGSKGVTDLKKLFDALRPLATVRVTIFSTLGQLLIPVLTWLGNFIAAHPSLGNWIVGVALAFQVLGPAIKAVAIAIDFFSGGPIGLIIIAIAALVAGFIYLWNTSSGFRQFWINLWHDVQNIVSAVVTWWTTVAVPFFAKLFAPIIGAFQAFLDFWHAAWNAGLGDWIKVQLTVLETIFKVAWDIISAVFVAAWDIIKGIVVGAWTAVSGIIEGGFTIIKGIFEIFTGILTGNWSKVWQGIKDVLGGAWTTISSIVKAIGDIFGGLGDAVGRIFGGIGRAIGDAIGGAVAVLRGIIGVIQDVINWFGRLFGAASSAQNAATAAANAGSSTAQNKARASGGSAFRNRPYLVGEHGPELFSPGRTGMVTSTPETAGLLGGGGPIIVQIGNETIAEITQAQIAQANRSTVRTVKAGVQQNRR